MPRIYFICNYCDMHWSDMYYSAPTNIKCPTCKDRSIKMKQQPATGNWYGYPEEEELNSPDAWISNDD